MASGITRQEVQKKKKKEKRQRAASRIKWAIPVLLLLVLAVCICSIISDILKAKKGIRPADTPLLDWLPWVSADADGTDPSENRESGQSGQSSNAGAKIAAGKGHITEEHSMEMLLAGGIAIIGIGGYTGEYIEDGSDEPVENVLMLTFENRGQGQQLVGYQVSEEDRFEFTSLLPGETVRVLEQNRAAYSPGMEVTAAEIIRHLAYTEEPSLMEDTIQVEETDGGLKVKNISGKAVTDGKIYYKYGTGGALFGGITYVAAIPHLEPEQEVVLAPSHYVEGESSIRFVTCDE